MMLMSLGVKQGETVTVTAEGADEDTAFDESFFIIARTFGKSALSYAKGRGFLS